MRISSSGGGVTRKILGLCPVIIGCVMILARFSLNLSSGTCWLLVGKVRAASLAPKRTNFVEGGREKSALVSWCAHYPKTGRLVAGLTRYAILAPSSLGGENILGRAWSAFEVL